MAVENFNFQIHTKGYTDIIDISNEVFECLRESRIKNGNVLVFVAGATSGITTIEYESGCLQDLKEYFERVAPMDIEYAHNLRWGDGNGFSHVRAALMKSSFTFPIIDANPILGTWQQLVLVDFDNRSRQREVVVQVMGE
ncbi:secondary thiamine-phosphate synthase enzyme YjbQ [Bacteroidota bacterium]